MGNREEHMECVEEARENCDACPELSPEEEMNREDCRECIMNCTGGRRGRSTN